MPFLKYVAGLNQDKPGQNDLKQQYTQALQYAQAHENTKAVELLLSLLDQTLQNEELHLLRIQLVFELVSNNNAQSNISAEVQKKYILSGIDSLNELKAINFGLRKHITKNTSTDKQLKMSEPYNNLLHRYCTLYEVLAGLDLDTVQKNSYAELFGKYCQELIKDTLSLMRLSPEIRNKYKPFLSDIYIRQGLLFANQDHLDEALEYINKGYLLTPRASLLITMAIIQQQQRQYTLAIQTLERAIPGLELEEPKRQYFLTNKLFSLMNSLYIQDNRPAEALKFYQKTGTLLAEQLRPALLVQQIHLYDSLEKLDTLFTLNPQKHTVLTTLVENLLAKYSQVIPAEEYAYILYMRGAISIVEEPSRALNDISQALQLLGWSNDIRDVKLFQVFLQEKTTELPWVIVGCLELAALLAKQQRNTESLFYFDQIERFIEKNLTETTTDIHRTMGLYQAIGLLYSYKEEVLPQELQSAEKGLHNYLDPLTLNITGTEQKRLALAYTLFSRAMAYWGYQASTLALADFISASMNLTDRELAAINLLPVYDILHNLYKAQPLDKTILSIEKKVLPLFGLSWLDQRQNEYTNFVSQLFTTAPRLCLDHGTDALPVDIQEAKNRAALVGELLDLTPAEQMLLALHLGAHDGFPKDLATIAKKVNKRHNTKYNPETVSQELKRMISALLKELPILFD